MGTQFVTRRALTYASIPHTPDSEFKSPRVAMQFSAVKAGVQFVHPMYLHVSSWVDNGSVLYSHDRINFFIVVKSFTAGASRAKI